MSELGTTELGYAELGAGEEIGGSGPVLLFLSISVTSTFSVTMNGTYVVAAIGSVLTVSTTLTVEVQLKPQVNIATTLSVGSFSESRYFGFENNVLTSVDVFLTVDRFIFLEIPSETSLSVHLTGAVPSIDLHLSIQVETTINVLPTSSIVGVMNWSADGSLFIHATYQEVRHAKMSWSGNGNLSILPGYTKIGHSAVQIIHVAESDGGEWIIGFEGESISSLPYNISAAELQDMLELLPTIGDGNIAVAGGPATVRPLIATFIGSLAETPVGMLIADGSGLTGPVGLNPHVTIRSLSQGYSADDDYGSLDDISIRVENNYQTWDFSGKKIDLKVSESDIGGDETATWVGHFTPPYNVPLINSKVIISDKRGPWWGGLLEQPSYKIKNGSMEVGFTSRGHFSVTHDFPFDGRRVFLIGTMTHDIFIAARDELTQSRISITNDFIATGRPIPNDTPDLHKQYASDVFDDYSSYGDFDDTPLVYGVRLPLEPGYLPEEPILYVEREAQVPGLVVRISDGVEVEADIDSTEIVNRYYVPWKIPNDTLERSGQAIIDHPTSAPETGRLRAQIATETFPSEFEAISYGTMLSAKHGAYRTAGGTISIAGGVPVFTVDGHVYPHWRIRPNILFDIPDLPDSSEGVPPMDTRATKFSWIHKSDAVIITTGRMKDLKRAFRQITKAPNQLNQQPNEPRDPNVKTTSDKSPPKPWQGNDPRDLDPTVPDPKVVDLKAVPSNILVTPIHFVISKDDLNLPVQVDFECIIRGVTAYAPTNQEGSASIIVGHSTYEAYGAINNLARLDISGNPSSPGKARDMTVNQRVTAGDVVYVAFPSPMVGFTHLIIALSCERTW